MYLSSGQEEVSGSVMWKVLESFLKRERVHSSSSWLCVAGWNMVVMVGALTATLGHLKNGLPQLEECPSQSVPAISHYFWMSSVQG